MRRTDPVKLMLRNLCKAGLESPEAQRSLAGLNSRVEVSVVNDLILQVKVFGAGNPLPAYLTVKVTGAF